MACQNDFRLFVTDTAGKIYSLNSDLTVDETFDIGFQTVGIAVDPYTTVDNVSFAYSTVEPSATPIWKRYSGNQTPEKLFSPDGNLQPFYFSKITDFHVLVLER